MIFINECNCIFDEEILRTNIIKISLIKNAKIREKYRIYQIKKTGYPMVCIGHKKYRIHNLILEKKEGYHVHHIDENILNNSNNNLKYVTPNEHMLIHNIWENADKIKLRENGISASNKITRHDVTSEKVYLLKEQGYTIKEIKKMLNCGYNTICRRLSNGNPKLLDWSSK